MLQRVRLWLFFAVLIPWFTLSEARADRGRGTIIGVVRNAKTQKPIEGAAIVATSTALQGEETATSDHLGLYRLPSLPPGDYTVQVFAPGYDTSKRDGVTLHSDTTIRLDLGVRASDDEEQVRVVVVDAPEVDVGSTSIGQTVDQEFTRRVPVAFPSDKGGANRSIEAVAEVVPGANNDRYGTSIAGTTSPENNYTIDGMNVGDSGYGLIGLPLSVEFVGELRIDAGGYMPEFGRATGGIINAITESGSNEFHGSVWGYYMPGQLEGVRRVAIREGSTVVTEPSLRWIGDAGFDIGGRLIKDRLWFYAGLDVARTVYDIRRNFYRTLVNPETGEVLTDSDGTSLTERVAGTQESHPAESTSLQAIAKLTLRAAKNHTVAVSAIFNPYFSGGEGSYGIDPRDGLPDVTNAIGSFESLAHTYDSNTATFTGQWNASTDNNKWLFDTTVGYHHQTQTRLPSDGSALGSNDGLAGISHVIWRRNNPEPYSITDFENLSPEAAAACAPVEVVDPMDPESTIRTPTCPLLEYRTGGPDFISESRFGRLRGRHMTTFFGTGAGHHEVKFGLDVEYLAYANNRGYPGQRLLRESTAGTSFFDLRQYGVLLSPDEDYIFDSLDYTSRSVIIGAFLQDSWAIMDKVTLNAGLRYDAQLVYGADGQLVISVPNQVAPRVGLIWDPTQAGRSKLFGSYARFYQSVPLDVADRGGSGEPLVGALWDAANCNPRDPAQQENECRDPANQLPVGGSTTPDQVWITQSTGKTPVDPDLKPQAQDEIVFGGQLEVFDGAVLALSYQRRWLVNVIEDMSRDEAQTYFIGNPGEGLAADFPRATRNYDAIILSFQKAFDKNWLLSASYTASWLRGNISGLFRPETFQLDPFVNSDFDLISLLPNRTGYLPGDHRHSVKVFSAGEVELGRRHHILFGGAFRALSGAPTDYLGSHPLYGDDEVYILPRGSGERLPWQFRIDTNIGYRYDFNDDVAIGFTIDAFNLMNFQAATRVDSTYTQNDVIPIEDGDQGDLDGYTDVDGAPVVVNPNFGRPIAFQTPRQLRFGLRLTF